MASTTDRLRDATDAELLDTARTQARNLPPRARAALHAEIEARGLTVGKAEPSIEDDLVAAVRALPCPSCGRAEAPLNAGHVSRTISYLLLTTYRDDVLVACPDCLAAEARNALLLTAFFGWWGFPWGPIRSVQSISKSRRTLREHAQVEPTDALEQFVRAHPDVAEAAYRGGESPLGGPPKRRARA